MIEQASLELDDRIAREGALDTARSTLVQAPAGSGKTELLAMRFLKLLAEVEEPEQILAITFTMNATAEIRRRILTKLEKAKLFAETRTVPEGEDRGGMRIAAAALANSTQRGWRLLDRPQSLNIQSIDALCLRITNQAPLSAKLAGGERRAKVAWPLYQKAARKTFDQLGGDDIELTTALKEILLLRDSNLASCERLLAGMLATRDQWARVFPLTGDVDWEEAQTRLEAPFQREIHRVLGEAHALLSSHPRMTRELLELADYACGGAELKTEIRLLAGLTDLPLPAPEFLDHWHCLCELVLTKNGQPRKAYNVNNGFPSHGKHQKARMTALAQELGEMPALLALLGEIRELPPPHFSDGQWKILRYIFIALRNAVRELSIVFAEQNTDDFTEVGIAALEVVKEGAAGIAFLSGIRHLLVDEFQDTSRRQHELVASILRHWREEPEAVKGRTFFLVGDPMQSIYMFRQADVELFDLVGKQGFEAGGERLRPVTLQLSTNFRSNAGVVKPLNDIFEKVFPHNSRVGAAAVDFLPGVPGNPAEPPAAFEVHASFLAPQKSVEEDRSQGNMDAPGIDAQQLETDGVLQVIRRHLPEIESARRRNGEFTVAVLARAKKHLASIAEALRARRISFRAVELEKLGERQEILDLQSLTRALLHPMDRIAWLAVLRAPWCGLGLRDLHLLCGTDERQSAGGAVSRQIQARLDLLDAEAKERVERVMSVLNAALRNRHRQASFSLWIERAWHSLGGPACVDAAGNENARAYFQMLEQVALDGIAASGEAMRIQLDRLFSTPDPAVSDRCGIQLMTMHKAKGLGFNVVILPGLHRPTRNYSPVLIRFLERTMEAGVELLVAPIDNAGDETSPLNRWVRRQKEHRETEERKRLLYVACTRARDELHLFATATVTNLGVSPASGSMLHTAWPALGTLFESKYAEQTASQAASESASQLGRASGKVIAFSAPAIEPEPGILDSVAAGKAPPMLRRLPDGWKPARTHGTNTVAERAEIHAGPASGRARPQASRFSRTLGTIVHALFERAAQLLDRGGDADDLRASIPKFQAQAATLARNEGLAPAEVESCAKQAAVALQSALDDPCGLWILKPHPAAQTEASWTGMLDGNPKDMRIDRSFLAGSEPLTEGEDYVWIVDYKTATHGGVGLASFLEAERTQYKDQVEKYGEMTRLAYGADLKLRFGLYYPFVKKLDWWK